LNSYKLVSLLLNNSLQELDTLTIQQYLRFIPESSTLLCGRQTCRTPLGLHNLYAQLRAVIV